MQKHLFKSLKRFWSAEEVPRWFGFSLVLVYLVGLGLVARFGMSQARRAAFVSTQPAAEYAFRMLTEHLTDVAAAAEDPLSARCLSTYQRALREFGSHVPVASLLMVDGEGRIVASRDSSEIGGRREPMVAGTPRVDGLEEAEIASGGQDTETRLLRGYVLDPVTRGRARADLAVGEAPSAGASPEAAADANGSGDALAFGGVLMVETTLSPERIAAGSLLDQAGALATIVVACGALFFLIRGLRTQFRGMRLVADRLQVPVTPLAQDLESLRIGDSADQVAATWNQLLDMLADLQEEVKRAEANGELSMALNSVHGEALGLALNAIPDAILYIVEDGRFDYVNATACRMMGWDEDARHTSNLGNAQASPIGEEVLNVIRSARLPDGGFESRTQLLEVKGTENAYRVLLAPLPGARHHGECVAVVRDVSQQLKADRARDQFVTQVTHELRTPLTNIRAYAETLSSGMFDDPKVVTECYNVITKETRRLSRLIEDILSVSQMEVGSIQLVMDAVDLKSLLGDGVRDVRGLADERNIDLQVVLPAKLEPIHADRDKLAVVVNNLLGNAIKYTQPGGSVVVGCRISEGQVEITVKDNGIGIDPADHARIFEKFERAVDPEVQTETGTGIGLYTAREIVRRHGGDIDLISRKRQGSTFIVRLPHSESRASKLAVTKEA